MRYYIFKYFDGNIYRNDLYYSSYENFIANNPSFPIEENKFFEYRENGFDLINEHGIHEQSTISEELLQAINELLPFPEELLQIPEELLQTNN